MIDFTFEPVRSPWDLALARLNEGDMMSAQRFLALMRSTEDRTSEEAVLDLEDLGIMLDVSDLPRFAGNPETERRTRLELQLLQQGGWSETLDEKDPLRLFVEELPQAMRPENPGELAKRSRKGEEQATRELMDGYLNVVFDCAKEYAGRGVLLMDLIQEGSLGLWQAVLSYRGGDFDSHAMWWIRQAMARAVTLQAESDGVGDHLAERMEDYRRAEKALVTRLGRSPAEEEIAVELGITLEETVSLGKMLREVQEMAKLKQENEPAEESGEEDLAVEDTAYYQTRERVSDLLSGLTQQETMVLNLRYGLNGKAPLSVQETAAKMNMTAAEVLETEQQALAKMRSAQ